MVMDTDWQTVIALCVVGMTVVFLVRHYRKKRRSGGAGCNCPINREIPRKR
jgi:hypothetical protein